MGSICIRNTNVVQTSLNNYKQSAIHNNIVQDKTSSSTDKIHNDDEIYNRKNSIHDFDQPWSVENREDRKWHDDLIYS
ncbi:hypothetical protein I4U23_019145 [Adineta vaga]|nr:hypothetical protein I4U23_019145 [Adineta vaga]